MPNSYLNKFQIKQTIENNTHQNILMGFMKANEKDVVIINILHSFKDIKILEEDKLKKVLQHLIHVEKKDDDLIVVTKMQTGISLDTYMKEESPIMDMRLSMFFQYLKKIKNYNLLNPSLQKILTASSQVFVNKGIIKCNELLVIGESFVETKGFESVIKNIQETLECIFMDENDTKKDRNDLPPNILKFMS